MAEGDNQGASTTPLFGNIGHPSGGNKNNFEKYVLCPPPAMIHPGCEVGEQPLVISSTNTQADQPQLEPNTTQYQCCGVLNLYDSPKLERLATQAAAGRYLRILASSEQADALALEVQLCEDDYPGWLSISDLPHLTIAPIPYKPVSRTADEIQTRIPAVIAFMQAAMNQPNEYLWGGTVAPNYDCSGLMQAAFASAGIWLPRDAYQQEGFTQTITFNHLQPGDLVFFGTPQKATHVGLYLGNNQYIHSSGKDQGHNGIAIDVLSNEGSVISCTYFAQLRQAGRVVESYQSTNSR